MLVRRPGESRDLVPFHFKVAGPRLSPGRRAWNQWRSWDSTL